jgi:hypothetical protein
MSDATFCTRSLVAGKSSAGAAPAAKPRACVASAATADKPGSDRPDPLTPQGGDHAPAADRQQGPAADRPARASRAAARTVDRVADMRGVKGKADRFRCARGAGKKKSRGGAGVRVRGRCA